MTEKMPDGAVVPSMSVSLSMRIVPLFDPSLTVTLPDAPDAGNVPEVTVRLSTRTS